MDPLTAFLLFLYGVISVIAIIVFFVLAGNVNTIKKLLKQQVEMMKEEKEGQGN
ncbi:MAG: hypothetical protein R6T99_11000 [Bacteroidales bacterium]